MLHTHLEHFTSKCPIIAVSLTAQPIKPAHQQFGLFETALRDPSKLYETLARLTALLGTARAGTPVLEETHRPDAFRIEPFSWQLDEAPVEQNDLSQSPALRRFRFPAPVSIFFNGHKPTRLESEEVRGTVADQRGPYHLSGNWWDEKAWARAEWDLQLGDGAICRCHRSEDTSEVDGIYD